MLLMFALQGCPSWLGLTGGSGVWQVLGKLAGGRLVLLHVDISG